MDTFSGLISANPIVQGVQYALMGLAGALVFLVFYATRDILQRSRSLPIQLGCILMVAALPVVGFLLYMILRPSRTLSQKDMEVQVAEIRNIVEVLNFEAREKSKRNKESEGKEENSSTERAGVHPGGQPKPEPETPEKELTATTS